MARDHRKLHVFHEAHALVRAIYQQTQRFPRHEEFGVRAQLRRAAVSIATNIVEGSARRGTREYLSFLNIARGSAAEVLYLITLTTELGYYPPAEATNARAAAGRLVGRLQALVNSVELMLAAEEQRAAKSPKPKA